MDDKISRTLKTLPRERAGAEFTAGVLRRLEARDPRTPGRRPLVAAAVAALLLALAFGAREWWHLQQRQEITTRLESLAAERQALAAELAALERQLTEARPVVYLGGSNEVDLVLDLARLQRAGTLIRPRGLPRAGVRPPGVRPPGVRPPGVRPPGVRPPEVRPDDIRTASYEQRQKPPIY